MLSMTRRQLLSAAVGATLAGGLQPASAAALTINPRSSWATNRPPKGSLPAEEIRFLLVHHSASRNGHTGADAPGILRSFYDFHTGEKGWNDVAYNFLIDADGGIWEGRSGSLAGPVAGDATGGNQGFSQLVCIIGDYNAVRPTQRSLDSLVLLLAWLADRYRVSTAPGAEVSFVSRGSNRWPAGAAVTTPTITGHRTMSKTTCPGDHLYAHVAGGLTADVERVRGGSAPPPTAAVPTSAPPTTAALTTAAPTSAAPTSAAPTTAALTTAAPTTLPSTTTTEPMTRSTRASTSTTIAPSGVVASPTTTPPVAASVAAESDKPPLLVTGAGALVAVGAGLLLWRKRRIDGG
ncbi:MAG: N-acetylmuramoyl-L-alanine amidase [Acidimicrobiia bacterium]